MPLIATRGAASAQGFGEFAQSAAVTYIEEVFSTYLYTGNGSTQTITNGIDLSTKGGLLWLKARSTTGEHALFDTTRGTGTIINSDSALAARAETGLASFNTDGFSFANAGSTVAINFNGRTFASWSFREQAKFFDVVTWTGNGTTQAISHNLGTVPGFIMIKRTSEAEDWWCFHRYDFTQRFKLNATNAAVDTNNQSYLGNNTIAVAPTSTTFTVGSIGGINSSGGTFVAYLFAHNAGGFGLTGTDNVISCGSYDGNGSVVSVNLGYEPQFIIAKKYGGTGNWFIEDVMRGASMTYGSGVGGSLFANLSNAEDTSTYGRLFEPTATGFNVVNGAVTDTMIYIAIRRGPMKVPTSGTSVFSPNISSGSTGTVITTNFPVDMQINAVRDITFDKNVVDRLRGVVTTPTDTLATRLRTNLTNAEGDNFYSRGWNNTGFQMPTTIADASDVFWSFRRAPSFFDEVCYTGTGSATTFAHNLGVAPEMMIFKRRDTTANWRVYHSSQPASDLGTLNSNIYFQTDSNVLNSTAPTSSVFTVGTNAQTNASGGTYVAYLFATAAGVSKVGSYTGTGTTLQINCGFTGGSRFVFIKRVDDSADWYVWDSARGIVSGNDPYLLLNTTGAEVTNTDYIDTYSAGFEISSTAPSAINASGGTFIFLAIA